jgi:2-keto-3-deoxy-L-rhamnonate aldolase RhmA
VAAKKKVLDATLAHRLIAGVHFVQPSTAAEDCRQAVAQGYRFIALGTDILFLGDSARALQQQTRECAS